MQENDISHASDCVYYDSELKQLRRSFDEIYKVFKRIEKRASRAQTIQISKSVFDWYSRKADLKVCPQKYYDFRFGEYRICLYVYHSKFSILCLGFQPPFPRRDEYFPSSGTLYGEFDNYRQALPLLSEILYYFCTNVLLTFDFFEDIPF